ncbi:MAG: 50S ribosomal protein L11 methyltransferase [Bacteroidales bacterium]|jgi:ribosomal protein L11 methyltransferase|nr:50S ribosomal protein L11 methyltransferase [Bacteroidales bacterium]
MNYLEISIAIPRSNPALSDILVAFLAELDFDSFCEENGNLMAYIEEEKYNKPEVDAILEQFGVSAAVKVIPQENWNRQWEENFSPIVVDDNLAIKAPFHSETFDTKHTIIIEPKMSFGTGHHATTSMMCRLIAELDLKGKVGLDMGCGTGILAIYASILGASKIYAIDIDQWAYENTVENAERNGVSNIVASRGDVQDIPEVEYDFVFANINLNILKKQIPTYAKLMKKGAVLLLSGFFLAEIDQIKEVCASCGLSFVKCISAEEWTACVFEK